jgi:hypothetical protein
VLPPSPSSNEERAEATRHHDGVLARARILHRRRVMAPRAALLVVVALAVALPLTVGRSNGVAPAAHDSSTSTGATTTTLPGTTVPPPTTTPAPTTSLPQSTTTSTTGTTGPAGPAGTTGTTGTTSTTTTVPAAQPYSNSVEDVVAPGTLGQAQWTVPDGEQFNLTSYTLRPVNDVSETGQVRIQLLSPNGQAQTLVEISLSELESSGSVSETLTTPVSFSAYQAVALSVACDGPHGAACDVDLSFAGTVTQVATTPTTTTTTTTTIPFS